jgi:hypothetical protein
MNCHPTIRFEKNYQKQEDELASAQTIGGFGNGKCVTA